MNIKSSKFSPIVSLTVFALVSTLTLTTMGTASATTSGDSANSSTTASATSGAKSSAAIRAASAPAKSANSFASPSYIAPEGHIELTMEDLKFMLDQIKIAEAHSDRTAVAITPSSTTPYPYDVSSSTRCLTADDIIAAGTVDYGVTGLSNVYPYDAFDPWGMRQVDGQCNNITVDSQTRYGAAGELFPRLSPRADTTNSAIYPTLNDTQRAYSDPTSTISDPAPRMISNLISDQTVNNPAAVAAANYSKTNLYPDVPPTVTPLPTDASVNVGTNRVSDVLQIPNVTPDFNNSAGYDSWFTLFGQFFDHGLDLIPKAGPTVIIPLNQSDSLYKLNSFTNYMSLTRSGDAGTGDAVNSTTPWVDQSQTYGSHASQNFFLREYSFKGPNTNLVPTFTGELLEGTDTGYRTNFTAGATMAARNAGMPTWRDIKEQTRLLGFILSDYDISSVPFIATDQYGKFIPGPNGRPMMLFTDGSAFKWVEGSNTAPVATTFVSGTTWSAVKSGTAFLLDVMATAVPFSAMSGRELLPDNDNIVNSIFTSPDLTGNDFNYYDDESLDMHFIAGDGRINENIGLQSMHRAFHGEHNLLVQDIMDQITTDGSPEFISEWKTTGNVWNGDRLYQAARFVMEMEYQHVANGEFIRRIAPQLPAFVAYDNTVNAAISAEFASAVYRLGHSMLNEDLWRSNPGAMYDAASNQDVSLIGGFTNPMGVRNIRPAVINSASYVDAVITLNRTYTFVLAAGEPVPAVGKVVSISGMANPDFNLENLVVSAVAGQSFSATKIYSGNSSAGQSQLSGTFATPIAPTSASANGTSITFQLSPQTLKVGQSINIRTCVATPATPGNNAARFNLTGAVVSSVTSTSFTVLSNVGTGTAPAGCVVTVNPNTTSLRDLSGVNIAKVTINDDSLNLQGNQAFTSDQAAAMIAQGLTAQRGNEIDEFVTDSLRNNLLGLPLDLASINIARGREVGLPTLNQFRSRITAANAAGLPAYISWNDFIANLRYAESGVNFIAAYGTHPTITTTTLDNNVTGSTGVGASRTYTGVTTTGLAVGDVVSFTGFDANPLFNISNAVISAIGGNTITVTQHFVNAPSAAVVASNARGDRPAAIDNDAFAGATGDIGVMTRETTEVERRAAANALLLDEANVAAALLANPNATKTDAYNFVNSLGVWATQETGINNVDLWIGGLAENPAKQPVLPPMLGTTFQYVFMDQMLKLQNGDRFYYLSRSAGLNVGAELELITFSDIVKRNTPTTPPAPGAGYTVAFPSLGFSVVDCYFAAGTASRNKIPAASACASAGITYPDANSVNRNSAIILDNAIGFADPASSTGYTIIAGNGDDMLQGSIGADTINGGPAGGDLLDGFGGDDILLGVAGEDLLRAGQGNDVLNGGDSQLGDIAGGGSGNDFIHSANNLGTNLYFGESGNDFVQGGGGVDVLLGGEGDDWVEGLADLDTIDADNGLNGGGGQSLNGGNDVLNGGAAGDLLNAGPGDDILLGGDGFDAFDGGTGFDWVNYETTLRDVYVDLSGFAPTVPANIDGWVGVEAVSGSSRADVFYTHTSTNHSVEGVRGTKGLRSIMVPNADLTIDAGMLVSGPGIQAHTWVVAINKNLKIVDISTELMADLNGTVTFTTAPLYNTSLVTGLSEIVTGTPGYDSHMHATGELSTSLATRNGIVTGNFFKVTSGSDSSIPVGSTVTFSGGRTEVATVTANYGNVIVLSFTSAVAPNGNYTATFTPQNQWSGGNIILGGAGTDKFTISGGSNIIDGKSYLHTCISATKNAAPYQNLADVACNGGLGYSTMSRLAVALENRTLNPSDLSIVREILDSGDSSSDTVYYTLNKNNYAVEATISQTPQGNVIYRVSTPDGIDILRNINTIVFADTSCAIADAPTNCSGISIPNTPVISAVTTSSATVTFTYSGLVTPTSFSVTSNPPATGCIDIPAAAPYTCNFTGLAPGTPYTFYVTAKKDAVTSSAASASTTTLSNSGSSGGSGGAPSSGGGFAMPAPAARITPTIEWNIKSEISDETDMDDSNVFTAKISTPAALSGSFQYNVMPGSHLSVGQQTLTVSFIPKDQTAYDAVTKTIQVTVVPSSKKVSLNVSGGQFVYDGSAKEASVTTSLASSTYRITYNGSSVAPKDAGTYDVEVTPVGTPARFDAVKSTLTITKAKPVITWNAVKTMRNGVALTAQHLNATASTAGKFTYSTKLGTVLPEGINGILVKFVPADTKNYLSASTAAQIEVGLAVDTLMVLPDTYLLDPTQMDSMSAMFEGVTTVTIVGYAKASGKKSADTKAALARSNALKAQLSSLFPDITFKSKSGGSTKVAACSKVQNQCLIVKVTG